MDERRATHLGAGYGLLSEAELQVVPIIAKCLEGMKVAADAVDAKNDSQVLIELHKSGFARPGDVEFEDFSQPMNRAPSDSSLGTPSDGRPELRGSGRSRAKRWPFSKKNKVGTGTLGVLVGRQQVELAEAPTGSAPATGTPSPGQEFSSWLLAQAGGGGRQAAGPLAWESQEAEGGWAGPAVSV